MRSGYARTTVLIAAALLGLVTITLLYMSIYKPWKRPSKNVIVAVATEDISADTVISPSMIRIITIPESELQPNAATTVIEVAQKVTTIPIMKGNQFIVATLLDKSTAFGLAGIIPPGTRAMTITVDSADAVSGFLQPGDHIDVLATFAQGSDSVARTILQNVVLLAVNSTLRSGAREQPAGGAPSNAAPAQNAPEATTSKVTIAVTPPEAEQLVAAQYKGKLKIGLRGRDDNSRYATRGASLNKIFGIVEPSRTVAPMPVQQPIQNKTSVKVIKERAAKQSAFVPNISPYSPLPPLAPMLQLEPSKIRVIKGDKVQEVEVGR